MPALSAAVSRMRCSSGCATAWANWPRRRRVTCWSPATIWNEPSTGSSRNWWSKPRSRRGPGQAGCGTAVYLGLREDKAASEVVLETADPEAPRRRVDPQQPSGGSARKKPVIALPPKRTPVRTAAARADRCDRHRASAQIALGDIRGDYPDAWRPRGVARRRRRRRDHQARPGALLAAVAEHALPGLAKRPLAVVRCPEGIGGQHFFQKHSHGSMPAGIREGVAEKARIW